MTVHDGLVIDKPVDAVDGFKLRAESVKDNVEGWSVTVSNLDQINQITKRLDENLRQGALCIGDTTGVLQESCRLKFKVMPPCLSRFQMTSFPG